jgi:colanic acid/amylovoran biosynthesis glycosyltransferase
LIAATFREKKGIPDALRAIERVRQRYPQLEVTLIGDSGGKAGDEAEKQKILPLIRRLGNAIRWVGVQPYSVYEAALYEHDLFLSPSLTGKDGDSEGGAPVTLIEAQASGMPVVSTMHADIPEIVLHDRTGLLSPENDIDALTANLERLVSSPGLWGSMGRAGRKHVETNHDIRLQTGKLERIYAYLTKEAAGVS